MQNKLFILIAFTINIFFSFNQSIAGAKKVNVVCTEQDANIFADEVLIGTGTAMITVPAYAELHIRIEKIGFEKYTTILYNKPNFPIPPKSLHVELKKDEAFESSERTDFVNKDIEIETTKDETEAWKLISRIITSYFDVLEVTDKETGYIRTAWVIDPFTQTTIRTRVIVKLSSTKPLAYKIKLVSEFSLDPDVSTDDQKFKVWDRSLRKYNDLIPEMQTRLK